jgi:NosR/NirI family nitrous oxide reductase transcriptional regulator
MTDRDMHRDRAKVAASPRAEPFDDAWESVREHVFPWGRKFSQRTRVTQAASIAFALTVTMVWVLGLLGRIEPLTVGLWWAAWSVFELAVRVACKPWFGQGRNRRPARRGEVAFYVFTKNALIGAVLFLAISFFNGGSPA